MDESSEHLLKKYIRARERGDRPAMQEAWNGLVSAEWDYVKQAVNYGSRGVLYNQAERDDALSEASLRLTKNLVVSFDGTTLEEWRDRVAGLARNACKDVQRKEARHHGRIDKWLDATGYDGDEPAAGAEAAWADVAVVRERDAQDADALQQEFDGYAADFTKYLPHVTPRPRTVMEHLLAGKTPEQVADRLGISRNAVDKNKERAVEQLHKLKEQDES